MYRHRNLRIVHVCNHSQNHIHLGAVCNEVLLHKVVGADWRAHKDGTREREAVVIDIQAVIKQQSQPHTARGPPPQAGLVGH
jgi:hypothetical protein